MTTPAENAAIRDWLTDHGADWFERFGNWLASPWLRLASWCNNDWRSRRA